MNKYWLEIKNLDLEFNNKTIIKNLDLKLDYNQNTAILGPNGSGKSTLIRAITKLKYPLYKKSSEIKVCGSTNLNIWDFRNKINFLLTDIQDRIKENCLAKDVILSGFQGTFGLINPELITSDHIYTLNNIIETHQLEISDKYFRELSDGLKRRVLLARSIINSPDILILDEPTSFLDLKSFFQIILMLNKISRSGISLLYTTNSIGCILNVTHRVILLKKGVIIADDKPEKVITSDILSHLYDYNLEVSKINGFWHATPVNT
ncbi:MULTISPECIES: ATP-binding cassette domain-containing protein [Prochlorococcus]|uniref:ATP-binding cassette domain-containing protein n=1 Tax=Prochlorococcus TaxID=1218 RepID=UPI000533A396|nr:MULTISPECIES: ATP-binding cassette domain-containing protein [Prochlorococcus]KGG12396.1 ABC-type molybdenum transport system ATPase component [Prochlorococcus sp. MIT 0601]